MYRAAAALLAFAAVLFASTGCSNDAPDGAVHVVTADGEINPVMERFLDRAIGRAEDNGALLVVIELDTPGGLSSSMREIVQRMERSTVPIAVYVYPAGGRAASAGTFITMAGNIAAMAPNTSIGAAAAINSDGSDIGGTLGKKVENDSVAFIRGIAELRGRNADWAEQAVREAVAVDQSKAVELGVVDFVANDLADLLKKSDGRTLELRPGTSVTLSGLSEAGRVNTKMTAWEHFVGFFADPTVASLLISLGFMALLIELWNPGLIVPGTAGVIAITLGFLGFDVLPVDTAGLVLILLGLAMIAMELFVPGGILGASGTVALILGAVIAFRDTPSDLRPPEWLLAVIAVVMLGGFGTMTFAVARLRGPGYLTGPAALVGQIAVAGVEMAPTGWVQVNGERWQARLEGDATAAAGASLRVTRTDGQQLWVRAEGDEGH
ncbi:MAG: nodulation protein NfeD [Chloroflexi bacterium]|nr:nodulation protein NfeD [Chloroflexota bacterium]